jgi:hypothetical protein
MELPDLAWNDYLAFAIGIAGLGWFLWAKVRPKFQRVSVVEPDEPTPFDAADTPDDQTWPNCGTLPAMQHYYCLRAALASAECVQAVDALDTWVLRPLATGVDVEVEE